MYHRDEQLGQQEGYAKTRMEWFIDSGGI